MGRSSLDSEVRCRERIQEVNGPKVTARPASLIVVPRAQMIWSTAKKRAAAVRWSKLTTWASTFGLSAFGSSARRLRTTICRAAHVIVRQQAQTFPPTSPDAPRSRTERGTPMIEGRDRGRGQTELPGARYPLPVARSFPLRCRCPLSATRYPLTAGCAEIAELAWAEDTSRPVAEKRWSPSRRMVGEMGVSVQPSSGISFDVITPSLMMKSDAVSSAFRSPCQ